MIDVNELTEALGAVELAARLSSWEKLPINVISDGETVFMWVSPPHQYAEYYVGDRSFWAAPRSNSLNSWMLTFPAVGTCFEGVEVEGQVKSTDKLLGLLVYEGLEFLEKLSRYVIPGPTDPWVSAPAPMAAVNMPVGSELWDQLYAFEPPDWHDDLGQRVSLLRGHVFGETNVGLLIPHCCVHSVNLVDLRVYSDVSFGFDESLLDETPFVVDPGGLVSLGCKYLDFYRLIRKVPSAESLYLSSSVPVWGLASGLEESSLIVLSDMIGTGATSVPTGGTGISAFFVYESVVSYGSGITIVIRDCDESSYRDISSLTHYLLRNFDDGPAIRADELLERLAHIPRVRPLKLSQERYDSEPTLVIKTDGKVSTDVPKKALKRVGKMSDNPIEDGLPARIVPQDSRVAVHLLRDCVSAASGKRIVFGTTLPSNDSRPSHKTGLSFSVLDGDGREVAYSVIVPRSHV